MLQWMLIGNALGDTQPLSFAHLNKAFVYLTNPRFIHAWIRGDWANVIDGDPGGTGRQPLVGGPRI